jgi:hypothetical protein
MTSQTLPLIAVTQLHDNGPSCNGCLKKSREAADGDLSTDHIPILNILLRLSVVRYMGVLNSAFGSQLASSLQE